MLPQRPCRRSGANWVLIGVDFVPSSPPKSLTQKAWKYNDGSGDVGSSPSQFLLVRGLDTMMQEETIAKGMEKFDVEPKRIVLIRDRISNISWGFGFVEYQDASVCSRRFSSSDRVLTDRLRERCMRNRWNTKRSRLKSQRSKSPIVMEECLFLCTPTQASTLSKPPQDSPSHTGTKMPMHLNGLKQGPRKVVFPS